VAAVATLPVRSCLIDGEAIVSQTKPQRTVRMGAVPRQGTRPRRGYSSLIVRCPNAATR
jgi:hypothetical protein